MTRRGKIILASLIAAAVIAAFLVSGRIGARVAATTSIDTDEITLGDTINYRLTIVAAKDADVALPDLEKAFEQFTVREKELTEKEGLFRTRTEYRYALTKYRPGAYRIPGMVIDYSMPGEGAPHRLRTQPFDIQVNGVLREIKAPESTIKFSSDLAGGGQFRATDRRGEPSRKSGESVRYPIKDIPEPKGLLTYQDMGSIAVAALASVALFFFIIFFAVKLLHTKKASRVLLPHELALEQLKKLKRLQLFEKGQTGPFCLELSSILKGYVQARLGIGAIVMTTKEFLAAVEKSERLNDAQKKYVADLIAVCDLVKYAQYAPKQGELDPSLEREKRFVEETVPVAAGQEEKAKR